MTGLRPIILIIFALLTVTFCKVRAEADDYAWQEELPRESWEQFELVDLAEGWSSVYSLPGNVYALFEDGQSEEVISYLICGETKALLWDTGLGIGNIRSVVEQLTDLPVMVLNSHHHPDHIGGNSMFENVYCYDIETATDTLTEGVSHEELLEYFELETVWKELPQEFDPETWEIRGKSPTGTVHNGQEIDLEGRALKILYTLGHCCSSIMLTDEENHLMFTEDAFYPEPLYAYFDDSDIYAYADSIHRALEEAKKCEIEWLYCSHNETVHALDLLEQTAVFLEEIVNGNITEYIPEDGLRRFDMDEKIQLYIM